MDSRVYEAYRLGLCGCKGAGLQVALKMQELVPSVVRALKSPLSASTLSELFVALRVPAFAFVPMSNVVIDRVTYTTLRLLKPKCPLDPAWEQQNLGTKPWEF